MNFWERVDNLLDEKGITKKELAAKVDIEIDKLEDILNEINKLIQTL